MNCFFFFFVGVCCSWFDFTVALNIVDWYMVLHDIIIVSFILAAYLVYFINWFSLYFAKIGLGNPSKDYYVQVDTGSDILWVNCIGCDKCPTKSDLGVCFFIIVIVFFCFVIYVFLIMQGLLFKNRLLFCYFVTDKIDTVWSSQLCVCNKGFLWWRFLYFHIQWLTSWLQKRIALPIQCRLWGWKLNCWILCEWRGAVRASHWKPTNRIIKWDCYIWVSCSSPIIMWFLLCSTYFKCCV